MSLRDDRKTSADYVEDSGSVDLNAVALAAQYVPGTAEEKALVWKIDKRIIVSIRCQSTSESISDNA